MDRTLAVAVAASPITSVSGTFYRHASISIRALTGSSAGGRWGPPGAFPVLYLGKPRATVIGEAYRHLVDDSEGMTGDLVAPRRLLLADVAVTRILDLRDPASLPPLGVDPGDLTSSIHDHVRCQRIGQAAHQLGLHGIIAPSATMLGDTLALFEAHLPVEELPRLIRDEIWSGLPPDPRRPVDEERPSVSEELDSAADE